LVGLVLSTSSYQVFRTMSLLIVRNLCYLITLRPTSAVFISLKIKADRRVKEARDHKQKEGFV
jgi:hypothetical protein